MRFRFPVVIIDEDYRSENASGLGIRALAKAIEDEGVEVTSGAAGRRRRWPARSTGRGMGREARLAVV